MKPEEPEGGVERPHAGSPQSAGPNRPLAEGSRLSAGLNRPPFGSEGGCPWEEEEKTPPKFRRIMQEKEEEMRELQHQLDKAGEECSNFASRTRELDKALTAAARQGRDAQNEADRLKGQRDQAIVELQEAEEAHAKLSREWKDKEGELLQHMEELREAARVATEDHHKGYQAAMEREKWMQQATADYHGEVAALRVYQELAFQYGQAAGKSLENVKQEALGIAARAHSFILAAPVPSASADAGGGVLPSASAAPAAAATAASPAAPGGLAFAPTGLSARAARPLRASHPAAVVSHIPTQSTPPGKPPHQ